MTASMGFRQAISSLECDARPRPRFLMVTKMIPTSENLINNIYEILFVTCLASECEMKKTRQGNMLSSICSFPVILAQNVNVFLKKAWISIIATEKYIFPIMNN